VTEEQAAKRPKPGDYISDPDRAVLGDKVELVHAGRSTARAVLTPHASALA